MDAKFPLFEAFHEILLGFRLRLDLSWRGSSELYGKVKSAEAEVHEARSQWNAEAPSRLELRVLCQVLAELRVQRNLTRDFLRWTRFFWFLLDSRVWPNIFAFLTTQGKIKEFFCFLHFAWNQFGRFWGQVDPTVSGVQNFELHT